MAGKEFQVGDVVRLKSGGPTMTVEGFVPHPCAPAVWCSWFDGARRLQGSFTAAALVPASEGGAAR